MAKIYTIADDNNVAVDDNRNVKISEVTEITKEEIVMPAVLRQRYADELKKMEEAKIKANQIVDELIAINENTSLTITNIPKKL